VAVSRKVSGYKVDSARPGLAVPTEFDLDAMGTGGDFGGLVPVALSETVSVVEQGNKFLHKTVLTLTGHSVAITDATTSGAHGAVKVYDFPAGVITILGGAASLVLTAGAGGVADGAAVVAAVGTATVGTNNATLTTTEANIVASMACTLTDGTMAAPVTGAGVTPAGFDGTATAIAAFLNLAVPDADSSANDTISVTGTVTILWALVGDV
jgi:hypothetical protein